ncbi:type VI secretion system-associated FHA domain protein TagH [Sphaerotilus uruguayifluvii]|uniref:FHA domain-containing protein n=1 Tax=Sphaerotilus uruguayifluvii TaxID=2735897 RepID=A0ABX2G2Y5_9BURK|nr:type VI secretion system-associated FHA domain protein TagH [Leptothrix sp. C29]NRT56658.1 FHA domain-containing protein [Leptothrix sp. C29]
MQLLIRAVSLAGQPLTQAVTGLFDTQGGTLGRAETCTLMLPDPERHISRLQAEVSCGERGFSIRNVSHANPIMHNGRPVPSGRSAALADGDELQVGSYLLAVSLPEPAPAPGAAPAAMPAAPEPGEFTRMISVIGAAPASVPVASGASAPVAAPAPSPVPSPAAFPPAPSGSDLTDPFAFFGGGPASTPARMRAPSPDPVPGPARLGTGGGDPFGDLWGAPSAHAPLPPSMPVPASVPDGALPSAFGDLFGPDGGASGSDDVLSDFFGAKAPRSRPPAGDQALQDFLNPPAAPAPASRPPLADRTPEIHAPMVLPVPPAPVAPPVTPLVTPPPARAVPAAATGSEALWAAFCEGAGIAAERAPPGGLTPALMHDIGQMLHHAIAGTLQLIAARAATKTELHAQVTMIQPRHNNPLKFSPDARVALEQLLQPPLRGFLAGPPAVEQAMDDLVGHAVGTMAGMRAALDGVLDRFAPEPLEARLSGRSVIDSLLPMHRRARLWELYLQHFQAVREESREDVQALFGKAFLQAYEEQLDRLDAERRGGGGETAADPGSAR